MTDRTAELIFLGFVVICAGAVAVFLLLLMRQGWRWGKAHRRLMRANCPRCDYPLRFNGTEHWCSECGYKHPVRVDGKDESRGEDQIRQPPVERE